jgi:hypothetical protein
MLTSRVGASVFVAIMLGLFALGSLASNSSGDESVSVDAKQLEAWRYDLAGLDRRRLGHGQPERAGRKVRRHCGKKRDRVCPACRTHAGWARYPSPCGNSRFSFSHSTFTNCPSQDCSRQ